ncbi:BON domain-containing protein [Cupriavidus basilensis]|uniref:BON domain-containing protein n=1 Tax=Cupriavidus basilensis TaxID=68895 RepID=UPI0020A69532|nr:BON domain-containing protein [Cupriavidus basilensis]MCP3023121.1 BON domain-containing protein [Cupriavidus basilensis]
MVALAGTALLAWPARGADSDQENRGHDPFFQISSRIANCPEPLGPRVDEAQWRRDAHHRIEDGNHCYVEGRCRLGNAYQYETEIVESTQRRLQSLSVTLPGWRDSTLWLTVRGRWLLVQGCVGRGFPGQPFVAALREVADVEIVVDQITADPARGVPYPVFGGRSRPAAPVPPQSGHGAN